MTYQEQLKHPMWQKRRLEILALYGFECSECGDKETQLHVHHKYYEKSKKVWEYPDSAYTCLCSNCHSLEHIMADRLNKVIGLLSSAEKERVLGYSLACGDPFDFEPASPEMIDGMSDYFRIPSSLLLDFVIHSDCRDLETLNNFAISLFDNEESYRKRGM